LTVVARRLGAMSAAAVLALAGCSSAAQHAPAVSSTRAEASYGALPTFLPTPTLRPDSELTGDAARPAVTTEGDAVHALLETGSARITVTGPVVPIEGAASEPDLTTCTWTVTLTATHGRVPVVVSAFTVLDEEGNQSRPRLAPGSTRPPAELRAGRSAHFELRDVMSAGEGVLRWAPNGRVVASWDFVAETD
jgi:hypothetical protein